MNTIKELTEITWKSERTIRRIVKGNKNIRTKMNGGKITASVEDVLSHYNMTSRDDYPKAWHYDNQKNKDGMGSQMDRQWLADTDFKQVLVMTNELSRVSKENSDMRKALVQTEREFSKKLMNQEYESKNRELQVEKEYTKKEYVLKLKLAKSWLFSRFLIYFQLIIVVIILYILVSQTNWIQLSDLFGQ